MRYSLGRIQRTLVQNRNLVCNHDHRESVNAHLPSSLHLFLPLILPDQKQDALFVGIRWYLPLGKEYHK